MFEGMCYGVRVGQKLPPCPPFSLDETMEDEVYKNKKKKQLKLKK